MTTTKEGIEVRVGQIWRDLDKRMDRYCIVVELGYTGPFQTIPAAIMQVCRSNGAIVTDRKTKVRIGRMYRHSTGWELTKAAATTAGEDDSLWPEMQALRTYLEKK